MVRAFHPGPREGPVCAAGGLTPFEGALWQREAQSSAPYWRNRRMIESRITLAGDPTPAGAGVACVIQEAS